MFYLTYENADASLLYNYIIIPGLYEAVEPTTTRDVGPRLGEC